MKTFRGKEVIGWKVISAQNAEEFEDEINDLMDRYNFEDFQFSVNKFNLFATVLISKKE